ncbi:hypothetical protein J1614_008206 [Plenodomus biglobosus]|nr:hypothetical protein J1614_008206 [Plenodomus biglobosus]
MVYDESRNFLGDTYYKDSNELHEGDQLSLDKGLLVDVAEAMGVTQTDLTPLFGKKTKEPLPRPAATSQARPFPRPSVVAPSIVQRNTSQLRHKSLNTVLGTPKGPIGKAQPMRSPFEARKDKGKANSNSIDTERCTERRKTTCPPSPWRASSPAQEESPIAKTVAPRLPKASGAKAIPKRPSFVPPAATIIDIESEPDPFPAIFSDVTLPDTPPRVATKAGPKPVLIQKLQPASRPVTEPAIAFDKPPVQTPKIPRGKVPVPSVKACETPKQPAPTSSPPVSASNRVANVDSALRPLDIPPEKPPPPPLPPSPPRNPKAKSLRLSAGVKRGTLICQTLPPLTSRAYGAQRASGGVQKIRQASHGISISTLPSPVLSDAVKSHAGEVTTKTPANLAPPKNKRKKAEASVDGPVKRPRFSPSPPGASLDMFDDPQLIHGMMEETLLVPSQSMSPHKINNGTALKPSKMKSTAVRKLVGKKQAAQEHVILEKVSASGRLAGSPPMEELQQKVPPQKKVIIKSKAAPKAMATPLVLEAPDTTSRAVSPAHTDISSTCSRASSISPPKIALSTGGFNKRPKRAPKQVTTILPAPSPARRNETVALPPHPLRAGSKGPLMSTTELAALLQTSTKGKKPTKDAIEDVGISPSTSSTSPNRTFRRVRSENDAPIPSAAEDWEKRNLPLEKMSSALTDITGPGAEKMLPIEPVLNKATGLSALIKKTDPRRKLKLNRTQSLMLHTNAQVPADVDPPSPVPDEDVGPWSTEAGDLFDWRPPGR